MNIIKNYILMKKQQAGLNMLEVLMRQSEEFTRHRMNYAKNHNWSNTKEIESVWKTTKRWYDMVLKIKEGNAYEWGDL